MDLIFIVDPQIKVAAEEKARLERSIGRRNSNNYLLSRVELMKIAVATMARSHQDNEIHRCILAHLSAMNDRIPSITPVASGDAVKVSCENSPFEPPPSEVVLGLTASSTGCTQQQPLPLPLVGEQQVDAKAFASFLLERETEFSGGEPLVAKRLKPSSQVTSMC